MLIAVVVYLIDKIIKNIVNRNIKKNEKFNIIINKNIIKNDGEINCVFQIIIYLKRIFVSILV